MAKESERAKLMKQNFMELHNRGLTIPEIAERYDLSKITVYRNLQTVADENGVSRESLLQIIRMPTDKAYAREAKKVSVDVQQLKEEFKKAKSSITFLIEIIDQTLEQENEYAKENYNKGYTLCIEEKGQHRLSNQKISIFGERIIV